MTLSVLVKQCVVNRAHIVYENTLYLFDMHVLLKN